jgi:hypothetical protein
MTGHQPHPRHAAPREPPAGLAAMHTLSVILVDPKQHVIFFVGINLLVVHSETDHNLLRLV